MKLQIDEVAFDPASYADPNGRLFHWEGGIYRAVAPQMSSVYSSLLNNNRFPRLLESGLIETEIAPFELEGYELILKHRKIPFVSYGFEWCGQMLKDAALLVLDLSLELAEQGYELHDANPWNVLFDGCLPKYVDFGSIVPVVSNDATWTPAPEFIKCFLNPLLLISMKKGNVAREMMKDWRKWGVPTEDLADNLSRSQKWKGKFREWTRPSYLSSNRKAGILNLRKMVEEIQFAISETEWTAYYKDHVALDAPDEWTPKQQNAYDVLSRSEPSTVLDIGSNTGWYSEMAVKNGSTVLALDTDETCIQLLYDRFVRRTELLPILFDLSRPTPAHGTERMEFRSATERFPCDLVLALGLVHHLVFKKDMKFDRVAELLTHFAKNSLLVEFVPKEDRYVTEWYNDSYRWYTLENFVQALERGFSKIDVLPSNRLPRSLLFCTKSKTRDTPNLAQVHEE